MAIEMNSLKVSGEIAGASFQDDTYTPASGSTIIVDSFFGDACFVSGTVIKVVWDYGGVGETVLWSTNGSVSMIIGEVLTGTDGVKKLAVVCGNSEVSALQMSGWLIFRKII